MKTINKKHVLGLGCGVALLCAMAIPVWGGGADVNTATKDLKAALKSKNEEKTGEALQTLAAIGGKKAMKSVLKMLSKYSRALEGGQYWQLVNGAASFRDKDGLEELGKMLVKKKKGPAGDLLFALQNNVSANVFVVHGLVMDKGSYEHKLLVVDQLAAIKRIESGDLLVKALEDAVDGSSLKDRIINALQALTGQSLGDAQNWIGWWKSNREKEPFKKEDEEGATGGGVSSVTRDGARGGEVGTLERLKKGKVIVIEGGACCKRFDHNYDHIDQVLKEIGIECEVMTKPQFAAQRPTTLKKVMAILVNCTQNNDHCICPKCKPTGKTNMRMQTCGNCNVHNIVSDKMPQKAVELIKQFVEDGGYLFSEDWGLYEVIAKAWPNVVKVGSFLREADKAPQPGQAAGGRDQTALPKSGQVDVTPAPGAATHPYMRGVFLKPKEEKVAKPLEKGGTVERGGGGRVGSEFRAPSHKWTIDDDSPTIRIVDHKRVKVLLTSDYLRKKAKGDSAVAFMFNIGRPKKKGDRPVTGGKKQNMSVEEGKPGGRVLHVLSHFGKQNSVSDELAMRNLLYNFMLECARRRAPK